MTTSPRVESYELTPEQIQSYDDKGYLLIEDFFSPDEHKALESFCNEFQNWGKEKGKWMQYYEINPVTGESMLCRTENFTPYHEGMRNYANSPRLLEVLKKLHGQEYNLFKEKVNYKLPGGGGFPPHQDAPAFVQFGQYSHASVLFTIDETTQENGCLEIVPGGHKNEYEKNIFPRQNHDGSIISEWTDKQEWIPIYCKPGSILIFSAYLPHRSGINNTEKARKAVYLTYNCAAEGNLRDHYYAEKRKYFPPHYEREEGKDYSENLLIYNFASPIRF